MSHKYLQGQAPEGGDGDHISHIKDAAILNRAIRRTDKTNGLVARDFWIANSQEVTTHDARMSSEDW